MLCPGLMSIPKPLIVKEIYSLDSSREESKVIEIEHATRHAMSGLVSHPSILSRAGLDSATSTSAGSPATLVALGFLRVPYLFLSSSFAKIGIARASRK